MYCFMCGKQMDCELINEDERLELYHCYDCDTLYTLRDGTIDYLCDATEILMKMAEDLDNYYL